MNCELFYLGHSERPRKDFNLGQKFYSQEDFYRGEGSTKIFHWAKDPVLPKESFPQITLKYWRGVSFESNCRPTNLLQVRAEMIALKIIM
jgi:hypothetical protein